ncbi:endopeptidase catalytic subunit [Sporobolomyces salmoneus]|uniref:endopeptidase catalytic subunit n=1 Tax=Sporobolomyces salmoneus TaxID=183962 RepID=UPI00316BA321
MQPTLNPDSSHMIKDIVLLNRYVALAASHGDKSGYQPGDVVAVKSPINPSTLLIKRLVALPNSLVTTLPPYPEKTLRVPQGHCWIEGDEQFHSRDSNTFGPVPLGCVESRVDWILWPLSRFGPVRSKPGWEKRVYVPPNSATSNGKATSSSDNFFA